MDIIVDGFKLMAIGMGMVFIFLTIMVYVTSFMAKVLAPFSHLIEENTTGNTKGSGKAKQTAKPKSAEVVSAIVAAVHRYRADH